MQYRTLPKFPKAETCAQTIGTRAVDPVARVIHEWTYDAMIYSEWKALNTVV